MASSFSPRIVGVLTDFFSSLSMTLPKPAQDGSYTLEFERIGQFILTPGQEGACLILSLSRAQRFRQEEAFDFLSQAGIDPTLGFAVHAGKTKAGDYIYSIVLGEKELDLPRLELAMQHLIHVYNTLQA